MSLLSQDFIRPFDVELPCMPISTVQGEVKVGHRLGKPVYVAIRVSFGRQVHLRQECECRVSPHHLSVICHVSVGGPVLKVLCCAWP